jgi:aminoglycoside 3-N-acetyltransferase
MIDEIARIFSDIGLTEGDSILLYSNIASVAKVVDVRKFGRVPRAKMLSDFHNSIMSVIGDTGTVLTLGSFTDYARYGVPFHVDKSLPDQSLGAYPRYLFSRAECTRSLNPTSNLLGLGLNATAIATRSNATAYGFGTPWEMLIKHNAKIVFFDTTLRPMTFGHHIEQCVGVPHVYSKIYDTPVYFENKLVPHPVITSVRYLDFGIRYNMSRLETEAKRDGLVVTVQRNNLALDAMKCVSLAEYLTGKLMVDPYYLLDEPPKFKKGQLPFDGNAGPENKTYSNIVYRKGVSNG